MRVDRAATIQRLREQFRESVDVDSWRYAGGGDHELYRGTLRFPDQHLYVLVRDGYYAAAPATAEPLPGLKAEILRHLNAEIDHQLLPTCVVPDCGERAPRTFKAAERGRLASRSWEVGEEIRTCPEHSEDIYLAQGVHGRDELAEWLRPDAKLDALDEFDASYDTLHGREIQESRARMLAVKIPAGGES